MAMLSMTVPQSELRCLQKLGGGTYGKVYEALGAQNEQLAVKRNIVSIAYSGSAASLREMDILNAVVGHPFCLQLKKVSFGTPFGLTNFSPNAKDTTTDKLFFIMEKGEMDGSRYIHEFKPNWIDRKLFAVQMFLAVEFLHSRGIYHRDIKPANIICFFNSGRLQAAKLTDYGLAQYYTSQILAPPDMVTLWYRAPEIALRKNYGLKADIWSLGCVLYELFSGHNLIRVESDEQLINAIIPLVGFPREDFNLARQLFGRSIKSEPVQKSLRNKLTLPSYDLAAFNSSRLGGQVNTGKFEDLVDLVENCLRVDPKTRWSASEALNSKFFGGYREYIDRTRGSFGINIDGEWILSPEPVLKYLPGKSRELGMKWFRLIYSARTSYPIIGWYAHRIMFHAIEMFDRFISTIPVGDVPEGDILIWVNTFLFVSAKFFRIMQPNVGIEMFANGIPGSELDIFRNRALGFEEIIVRDIFKGRLYSPTLYEEFPEFLTEIGIRRLLELIFSGEISSGTSLKIIWAKYSSEIAQLNTIPVPTESPILPTVNLG